MTLYSDATFIESHSCRIVLHEKAVECQINHLDQGDRAEDLAELNPYNETPTLVDRELVLYGSQIINEYLDERLPHPPLMPVDPVSRGRARLMIMRIMRDWYSGIVVRDGQSQLRNDAARLRIRDGLISISPLFEQQAFMLSMEFSLVDCFMGPLLWRLPLYGVDLPHQAQSITEYANRIFERPSFLAGLSDMEHELR